MYLHIDNVNLYLRAVTIVDLSSACMPGASPSQIFQLRHVLLSGVPEEHGCDSKPYKSSQQQASSRLDARCQGDEAPCYVTQDSGCKEGLRSALCCLTIGRSAHLYKAHVQDSRGSCCFTTHRCQHQPTKHCVRHAGRPYMQHDLRLLAQEVGVC